MSSERDALWNSYSERAREGLRHGGVCPVHLKRYEECGCKEGFEDPGPVMQCAECGKNCLREAFINATGKAYPWCVECRRKKTGARKPKARFITNDKFLET